MVVATEHLANRFKDATLPAVLATPVMIMAMENAALDALKPYFEPGETAVAARVGAMGSSWWSHRSRSRERCAWTRCRTGTWT